MRPLSCSCYCPRDTCAAYIQTVFVLSFPQPCSFCCLDIFLPPFFLFYFFIFFCHCHAFMLRRCPLFVTFHIGSKDSCFTLACHSIIHSVSREHKPSHSSLLCLWHFSDFPVLTSLSVPPSAGSQPTLLPPEIVQELNQRSTAMLNDMQRLFSQHMIRTFGCDYSTSGVTLETVQNKLRSFLELQTADGPRHDTYLIFYSGHSQKGSGAWTLTG